MGSRNWVCAKFELLVLDFWVLLRLGNLKFFQLQVAVFFAELGGRGVGLVGWSVWRKLFLPRC